MHDKPSIALRNKRESSLRRSIDLVRDGRASACVSAGNTGALMAIARFVLKTLPGIDRPAICARMPGASKPTHVLDLGANVDSTSAELFRFAVMGAVLAESARRSPKALASSRSRPAPMLARPERTCGAPSVCSCARTDGLFTLSTSSAPSAPSFCRSEP